MKMFQLIPPDTNIDFIGKFRYFLIFSAVCLVATLVGMATKGLNYGIDFTGGTVVQVKFNDVTPIEKVRTLVAEAGEAGASVVAMGKEGKEYLITSRTPVEKGAKGGFPDKLREKGGASMQVLSVDVVGPKVGSELKTAAVRSLFYAIILIAIYIWFRFDFKFAPGATVAMVHDLTMATGFYLITGHEFSITAVAALLTIAGYSVNDTIVIYDRVREMYKVGGNALPLPETINKAVNLTLSRTLLTNGITLLSVIPVAIFCTGEIQDFAVAMIFGLFVGTYSTVYIASPMTIWIEERMKKRAGAPAGPGRPRPATA